MKYILFLLLPSSAMANSTAIMEGISSTKAVVYVDTTNARLDLSTTSYSGTVPTTSLYTSSNAVFSNTKADNVVIYSTGSIMVLGNQVSTSPYFASSTTTGGFSSTSAQTSFGVCITTLTITTNGNKIAVWFSGSIKPGTGTLVGLNILQDGAYVSPYTSTIGIVSSGYATNIPHDGSFYVVLPAPASGSHSYCLTSKVDSGTMSWDTTDSTPSFGVVETR